MTAVMQADGGRLASAVAWPVGLVVVGKVAVTLAFADRYGWHRDELYYAAGGRHLSLGYVDFNPIPAVLARTASIVTGDSLIGLRVLAVLAGVTVVVLTALLARSLGGGRAAQTVAALAVATSPWFLGANTMFQPVSFDQLAWVLCLLMSVRVLRDDSALNWVVLGATVGIAAWTKYTIVALAVPFGIALAVSRRDLLRRWRPLLAVAAAALVLAPNLWWQAVHGWPSLEFLRHQNANVRAEYPPWRYLIEQAALVGPVGIALAVIGIRRLWSSPALRPLATTAVGVVCWYLILRGKSYYPLTVYPILFAAGAVAVEAKARRWMTMLVMAVVVVLPVVIPVLPLDIAKSAGLVDARADWQDEIGWPDLTQSVADVYYRLPRADQATAVVITANYGEAGALQLGGSALGLPRIYSGHNAYWSWGQPPDRAAPVIVVGVRHPSTEIEPYFDDCTEEARIDNAEDVDNPERGASIWLCQQVRRPWHDLWPLLRHYS